MTPKLVLFDLDDVLCHYDRDSRVAALATLAGKPAAEVDAAIWSSGFEDEADRGRYTAENYLWEFGKRLGFWITREAWVENRRRAMTPWPEMLALAERVKSRARVALFTANGPLMKAELERIYPAVPQLFGADSLHFTCEVGHLKEEPQAFFKLLEKKGVSPFDTLFIDDRAENVAAAKLAGLRAHQFRAHGALRDELAVMGLA